METYTGPRNPVPESINAGMYIVKVVEMTGEWKQFSILTNEPTTAFNRVRDYYDNALGRPDVFNRAVISVQPVMQEIDASMYLVWGS